MWDRVKQEFRKHLAKVIVVGIFALPTVGWASAKYFGAVPVWQKDFDERVVELHRLIDKVQSLAQDSLSLASSNQRQLKAAKWFEMEAKRKAKGFLQGNDFEIWCSLGKELGYLTSCAQGRG